MKIWLDAWINEYKKPNEEPKSTYYNYNRAAQYFLKFFAGKTLETLTPQDIQTGVAQLQAVNLPKNTFRTYKTAWRSFLRFAHDKGLCSKALIESIEVERAERSKMPNEYYDKRRDLVINSEPILRNRVILGLTLEARCTIKEVTSLMAYNVNPHEQSITIEVPAARSRTLFLTGSVWNDLMRLWQDLNLDQSMFQGPKGQLTFAQVSDIIDHALQRVGVPAIAGEVCESTKAKKRDYRLV